MEATGVYWSILYEILVEAGIDVWLVDGRETKQVPGRKTDVKDSQWIQLLAETGNDLKRWPTEKHFTSWLGLAPGQHWSGKMRRNKRKKGHPKAGQIFRNIAQSLITSKKIALGSFGRRIRARKSPAIAIKAMARKLAETYWRVMVKGVDYAEEGVKKYEDRILKQKQKSFQRLAVELNMYIVDKQGVVL